MRVTSTVERLDVDPGGTGVVPLEVVNTSDVIESLSVRALGVPAASVRVEPDAMALFPDTAGEVTLTVGLPSAFPAGTYPVTFVVAGRAPGTPEAFHEVDLVVPARPALRLDATPTIVRTRGRAAFTLEVRNEGNVPLDVALRAQDTDRTVRTTITPSTLAVPAGAVGTATVLVRGPRQVLGGDRDRSVTVHAEAPDAQSSVGLLLRQQARLSRGLLTVLVLAAVVLAWALAFLLGTRHVLGTDAHGKTAPVSFFAATSERSRAGTGAAPAPQGAAQVALAPAAVPEGSLPKQGPLPSGVGGTVTGTVRGAADAQGLGRVTVVAVRERPDDGTEDVASVATRADGTFTLSGLFPGEYLLRVSDAGYDEVWHPAAASRDTAQAVEVAPGRVTSGADLALTGEPATLSGRVETGTDDATVSVTARPAWSGADPGLTRETTADGGTYAFAGLVAPGTYELTFAAEGFQPTTTTERVLGGQERFALDVRLGAGVGSIGGVVTDGTDPVGGVEVRTSVAGRELVVGTPTVGAVGSFVLPNLPTPATYVLTFTRPGASPVRYVVDLGPGQHRTDVTVSLAGGAGTVTGRVVDPSGAGVGGVAVTAGGTADGASTTTLTAGDVGAFTLTGLAPGTVTLTFTRDGWAPVTLPVTVPGTGGAPPVTATVQRALGTLTGRVTRGGTALVDVTVEVTDGLVVRSTTTTQQGARGAGTYVLADLPPGTWTVRVLVGERVVAASLVSLDGGSTVRDLPVGG